MTEERKYRTEAEEEESTEKRGLLRPLPGEEKPIEHRGVPMVRFLGLRISENRRDILVAILMPTLVAIINTAVYVMTLIDILPKDAFYTIGVPLLTAILIGMTVPRINLALLSVILCSIECLLMITLFLISPSLIMPVIDIRTMVLLAVPTALTSFLAVLVSSFVGVFIGVILQEFF